MYIDDNKLEQLKEKINNRKDVLSVEINRELQKESIDRSTYDYINQMKHQCLAELRVIDYIQNGMKDLDEFMV